MLQHICCKGEKPQRNEKNMIANIAEKIEAATFSLKVAGLISYAAIWLTLALR